MGLWPSFGRGFGLPFGAVLWLAADAPLPRDSVYIDSGLIARVRVLTTEGRPLSLLSAFARTLLICLVVPPMIFRPDSGRGLHDLWTGSAAYVRA